MSCPEIMSVLEFPTLFLPSTKISSCSTDPRLTCGGTRVSRWRSPVSRTSDGCARFTEVVEDTGWRHVDADAKLLMMHHAVEGARVGRFGMGDYTFTSAADVVRTADIPKGFTAILSGHIHRAQVLTRDLGGRPLPAPVLYPGSVERTSFAEKSERKGYLTFALEPSGALRGWRFHELPARPMVTIELGPRELARDNLAARLPQARYFAGGCDRRVENRGRHAESESSRRRFVARARAFEHERDYLAHSRR